MSVAPIAAVICFIGYALGYRLYSKYLSERVFGLRTDVKTPAWSLQDGVDYVPSNRFVLFGHHYASITGLAPMLGPAIAVIWGWLPAMLWVVLGSLFIGCVHDFSALVVSIRARGMSIGQVAEGIIGARAKTIFHLIIFFGIGLAMGVFIFVIATLFSLEIAPATASAPARPGYPQSVLPSAGILVMALIAGVLLYRKKLSLFPVAAIGFALTLVAIWGGLWLPTLGLPTAWWPGRSGWQWILLAYAFAASVLPVWSLLQPRDFINSLLLYVGLGAAYVGFFVLSPSFQAPAVNPAPEGAPPIFPFVFIVIACGAASGFHALVSSGTTAKQLDKETDARFVGYGGMIGESLLGLLAVLATTTGFASEELWHAHYASWGAAQGLASKVDAFISGSATFITQLGVPRSLAASFIAVVVVSFALTTLDSATRLLRYNIEEMHRTLRGDRPLNRYVSSGLAVGVIAFFAFYRVAGKPAGLVLWELFGTTNQLLAGLALLTVTLYLMQRGRNFWVTLIPCGFMLITTLVALVSKLIQFQRSGMWLLLVVGTGLLLLAGWLTLEAVLRVFATWRDPKNPSLEIVLDSAPGAEGA